MKAELLHFRGTSFSVTFRTDVAAAEMSVSFSKSMRSSNCVYLKLRRGGAGDVFGGVNCANAVCVMELDAQQEKQECYKRQRRRALAQRSATPNR